MGKKVEAARKRHGEELENQMTAEAKSREKGGVADVDVRLKSLEEEAEAGMLAELDRWFAAERETMDAALVLKRQEMALEREVEMELCLPYTRKYLDYLSSENRYSLFSIRTHLSYKVLHHML